MLGPVSAPTSPYPQVQDNRIQVEAASADRSTVASTAEPYSASAATAIAGNLNMMLLSAPERMSQNLVVLTEALASVLKMKQEPNEPLTAFAARLIDAISTLSPQERQKLALVLSDAFAGLQLRTLLQALRNPQGPEAATLAIFLELFRQKDRDSGARAVISSYKQNDETLAQQTPRDGRSTAPAQSSLPSAPTQPASPPSARLATPERAGPGTMAGVMPGPMDAELDSDYRAVSALPMPDTGIEAEGANLRALREMRQRIAASAEYSEPMPASMADRPAITPSPTPSAASQSTTVSEPKAESADPAPARQLPGSAVSGAEPGPDAADAVDTDPRIVAATPQSSAAPTLPAQLLEEIVETDLIRTLLALYSVDEVPQAIDAAQETFAPDTDEADEKLPISSAPFSAEAEADDMRAPSPGRPIHWEEQLALANPLPVADHRELNRANAPGDGLPLAFVNYVIESEDEAESSKSARKDAQEDEQTDEDEEDTSGADDDSQTPEDDELQLTAADLETDDPADRTDLGLSAPRLDDVATIPALPSPQEDPAQALYLRFSDFA